MLNTQVVSQLKIPPNKIRTSRKGARDTSYVTLIIRQCTKSVLLSLERMSNPRLRARLTLAPRSLGPHGHVLYYVTQLYIRPLHMLVVQKALDRRPYESRDIDTYDCCFCKFYSTLAI